MTLAAPLLARFALTRPRHEAPQERILDWLADAHAASEAALEHLSSDERDAFAARMRKVMRRCACAPDKIASRGFSFPGVYGTSYADEPIYDLPHFPHGRGTAARNALFAEIVNAYFEGEYREDSTPPRDLVHVTCTGYISPSAAQRVVAQRGWGERTRVTHAYHMGCYAALPAVRVAAGLLSLPEPRARGAPLPHVDIVHTELCSLHLDPAQHQIEQLVVQSLFADGFIRYSLLPGAATREPGLALLALHEQILPDSAEHMTWVVSDHGMQMTLSRDVPDRIARALRGFVIELYRRAGIHVSALKDSVFAVHPGGPKIIDGVREVLELSEVQVAHSRAVLRAYGNMSSATLPHIWQRVVYDSGVAPGTLVASFAFGPGLTICGALFEKRGAVR
jgi:predicted naringenin-chalcone synthase